MAFTMEQLVLVAVVLIAGFLLGFASRPSARRWKRKVAAQSASFTAYHADAEDRVRAAKERAKALEAETAALRADRDEAELEIAALRADREGAGRTIASLKDEQHAVPAMHAPVAQTEARPASGMFGGSTRDDLTRMRGIDGILNTRLFGLGILRFEDIEKLPVEDEMALEQRLALPVGTVARDQWRTQAALLHAGHDAEHAERFGNAPAKA